MRVKRGHDKDGLSLSTGRGVDPSLKKQKVLVVMPTYNEAGNIAHTIRALLTTCPNITILVVDDGSPDGTGRIADALSEKDTRVAVIHRRGARGLGPAYLEGFSWGLERAFDVICEMDMDGSHRPKDFPRLLRILETKPWVDVVVGSRRVPGGATRGWPWYRDFISCCGSWYARTVLGLHVKDVTAGFRAYRSEILRKINLVGVESSGYVFQIDMLRRIQQAGGRVVEVPIIFVERQIGSSKMDTAIVCEAVSRVSFWGLRRFWKRILSRFTFVQ